MSHFTTPDRYQLLQQKKPAEKQETEEERAVRLEALAIAAKEAAVRREEAARQKLLDRQKHEQVRMPIHCMVPLHFTDSMGLLHCQKDVSPSMPTVDWHFSQGSGA